MRLASKQPAAAVILEAPFTSVPDIAAQHYWYIPARYLVRDRFDSRAIIDRIDAPLLILHGEHDEVVPVAFGRALFEAAREPKEAKFFAHAGHSELHEHGAATVVLDFLDRHLSE